MDSQIFVHHKRQHKSADYFLMLIDKPLGHLMVFSRCHLFRWIVLSLVNRHQIYIIYAQTSNLFSKITKVCILFVFSYTISRNRCRVYLSLFCIYYIIHFVKMRLLLFENDVLLNLYKVFTSKTLVILFRKLINDCK